MSTYRNQAPLPDLPDSLFSHLCDLKVGSEITTVTFRGTKKVYGPVRVITGWDNRFKVWRYAAPDNLKKNVGCIPSSGCILIPMESISSSGFGRYARRGPEVRYYSANRIHITAAKAQRQKHSTE